MPPFKTCKISKEGNCRWHHLWRILWDSRTWGPIGFSGSRVRIQSSFHRTWSMSKEEIRRTFSNRWRVNQRPCKSLPGSKSTCKRVQGRWEIKASSFWHKISECGARSCWPNAADETRTGWARPKIWCKRYSSSMSRRVLSPPPLDNPTPNPIPANYKFLKAKYLLSRGWKH